jgi:hypothetical protein
MSIFPIGPDWAHHLSPSTDLCDHEALYIAYFVYIVYNRTVSNTDNVNIIVNYICKY